MHAPIRLELLAPAKNLAFGQAAIDHGADAVYIGGPSFGARAAAGNSISDIAALAAYAHRFNARVLLALNTILRDNELDAARELIGQAHEAGVDALIVQDMGLLELFDHDLPANPAANLPRNRPSYLPPLQLHASTQCNIRTPEKARFLQDVGFSQIVLARELNLQEIRRIAAAVDPQRCTLEFFVHGALCVSYSGQCSISHAFTGRSANRGECAQLCRLPYALTDGGGRTIAEHRHLLSLKDNDQTNNLGALIDAGIRSFKIEGRLKDLSYVKNITAHYRRELDRLIEARPGMAKSSAGHCTFSFEPRPEKTFNRGSTDYFVNDRRGDIGAFDSPKFVGTPVGRVAGVRGRTFRCLGEERLANGDGLAWYDPQGTLRGARVNQVAGDFVKLGDAPLGLVAGATLHRNFDQLFEKQLAKKSAERRLAVRLRLSDTADGLRLEITDETGISAQAEQRCAKAPPNDPGRAEQALRDGVRKLGQSIYRTDSDAGSAADSATVDIATSQAWFVPATTLNALRRAAIAALDAARAAAWQRPPHATPVTPPAPYPAESLDYLGNVFNTRARRFYEKHGVKIIADAFEANHETAAVSLMVTKHCLRYSFNLCPKQVKGIKPEPMTLRQESADGRGEILSLRFDCKACEMHVIGKLHGKRVIPLLAVE